MDYFGPPQLYPPRSQHNSYGHGAGPSVKREPDLFTPFQPVPGPSQSLEHAIATADHDTLTRLRNPAYMRLVEWAQNLKSTNDNQTALLNHYSKLLEQQAASSSLRGFPAPQEANTTNPLPSAFNSAPAGGTATSLSAAYATIPVLQPVAHPSKHHHPAVKFWTKADWTDDSEKNVNKGVAKARVKSEPDVDSGHSTPEPSKKDTLASNKKISFLENGEGQPLTKDSLATISKAFYDILNDLARLLDQFFPHTWSVAGERFKSFVIISLFNKFIEFRLCDGLWKVLEYCAVKFSDWERSGMPESVREQKTALKRKRREEKNRKNLKAPPPGTEVLDLDGDDSDSTASAAKKLKATNKPAGASSASSSTSTTTLPPAGSALPPVPPVIPSTEGPKDPVVPAPKKQKQRKSTLGSLTIPPVNSNIAVPVVTNSAAATAAASTAVPASTAVAAPTTAPKPNAGAKKAPPAPKPKGKAAAAKNASSSSSSKGAGGKAGGKKAQGLMPTSALTARNLYLADYRDKHGAVTADEYRVIWSAFSADPVQLLVWERKAMAAKEEAKTNQPKKATRGSKKQAPNTEQSQSKPSEEEAVPIDEETVEGENLDEQPVEEDDKDDKDEED